VARRTLWSAITSKVQALSCGLAIFLVKRKLRRRPADLRLWITLGRLYEVNECWDQAMACLYRASQLAPHNELVKDLISHLEKKAAAQGKTFSQPGHS